MNACFIPDNVEGPRNLTDEPRHNLWIIFAHTESHLETSGNRVNVGLSCPCHP